MDNLVELRKRAHALHNQRYKLLKGGSGRDNTAKLMAIEEELQKINDTIGQEQKRRRGIFVQDKRARLGELTTAFNTVKGQLDEVFEHAQQLAASALDRIETDDD